MLDEVLDLFGTHRRVIVDGTLGGGSHAAALLQGSPGLRVIGLDRDPEAVRRARRRLADWGDRFSALVASYQDLDRVLSEVGLTVVDGVLLDLGISSIQLDDPERGFSFQVAGPLDMRLDQGRGETAAELLARAGESELADLIFRYGEERRSRAVARAVVRERARGPIRTTDHLARVVASAVGPKRSRGIHPATRTFMALRIAVNDELTHLESFLERVTDMLASGGRLVVISFHSLEDRLVKQAIGRGVKGCVCPPRQPICTCHQQPTLRSLTRRPLRPGPDEVAANPRSRSARLRAAERL
jgi:16S rRNA (cytosine1402-N4)-methyltransferase